MLTFAIESVTDTLEEVKPLLSLHWEELALNQDRVPLDPQYEVYLQRDAQGEALLVVGRDAGKIAAYFVGFVAPGLHYRTCLTLTMDIFYVHPQWRGKSAGPRLFKAVEQAARQRGVQRMFVGSKLHKDASWLFERLGYTEVERYYSKWLGD